MNVGIVARHVLHNRALRETDADNQIVAALGKRAHRRFDRHRIAGFDVAQDNIHRGLAATCLAIRQHAGLSAFHSCPRCGIE